MTIDELLNKIDDLSAEQVEDLKSALAPEEPSVSPAKPVGKIRCKVCGFHKKPKKVLRETGICGVCDSALRDPDGNRTVDGDEIEVVGRMGKRGRNTVSVVVDGRRWKVKRLSSKHSEAVAAKHASKPKGFAKKSKRTGDAPKGLRTDSRIGGDREQRTHEQGSLFA